jgi:hypothetical protein
MKSFIKSDPELQRKDELIRRHYEKMAHWQSLLQDMKDQQQVPPPAVAIVTKLFSLLTLYNLYDKTLRICNVRKMDSLYSKVVFLSYRLITFTGLDKHTSFLWNPYTNL